MEDLKPIQVCVYQVKTWDREKKWTALPNEDEKKHKIDKFFITLHPERDEVFSQEAAEEHVDKWIGIKGLRHVPVMQILNVLRNELGWAPPI